MDLDLVPASSGFHHMYRCGVLGWAILDNENEVFEIRWTGLLLTVSVVIWLAGFAGFRAFTTYKPNG